ncbi:MAG: M23 family metallopeptidase, partial [Proteobacteria bacterium]|nr:M23 family metallopeptidase [Pseudomonadota bacterium]
RILCLLLCLCMGVALPALAAEQPEPEATSENGRMVLLAPVRTELGLPFLVRLTSLDPLREATVYWLGREVLPAVSVWNDKHIVLALLGTDVQTTEPGDHELVVVAVTDQGRTEFTRAVTVAAKKYPVEPERKVPALSRNEAERVEREAREAAGAVDVNTPLRRWFLPFDRPVEAEISGVYGAEALVGGRKTVRRGLDFATQAGTQVRASGTGRVNLVADHLLAGNSVYIDHGNGVVSMYFHLLRADVIVGQELERGDVIGLVGATGRAEVPKLHFAVAMQGRLVDPQPLFNNNADGLLPADAK